MYSTRAEDEVKQPPGLNPYFLHQFSSVCMSPYLRRMTDHLEYLQAKLQLQLHAAPASQPNGAPPSALLTMYPPSKFSTCANRKKTKISFRSRIIANAALPDYGRLHRPGFCGGETYDGHIFVSARVRSATCSTLGLLYRHKDMQYIIWR